MKINEIKELLELLENSTVEEFEMEKSGVRIRMRKSVAGTQIETSRPATKTPSALPESEETAQAAPIEEDSDIYTFTAPIVGTFYTAPKPDAEPFVKVGSRVSPGTVICVIEAMKIFNQIESDVSGEIVEVLVENGQPVEYGAPLFKIKTD